MVQDGEANFKSLQKINPNSMDIIRRKKTNDIDEEKFFSENQYQKRIAEMEGSGSSVNFGREYGNNFERKIPEQKEYANMDMDNEDEIEKSGYRVAEVFEREMAMRNGGGCGNNDDCLKRDKFFSEKILRKKFFFGKTIIVGIILLLAVCLIGGKMYFNKSKKIKERVLGVSAQASSDINEAIKGIEEKNFTLSSNKFNEAYKNFSEISNSLEGLGAGIISVARFIPGVSKLSSGYYLSRAGEQLSEAGEKISQIAQSLDGLKEKSFKSEAKNDEKVAILDIFHSLRNGLKNVQNNLVEAQENLGKVKLEDLPKDNQKIVAELKNKLPIITEAVSKFSKNSYIVSDLLGANGPRKYLFLFQNNQEMRATGGFIGSYGVLSIDSSGRISNFFIDGIFNPDGQLMEKIVPPKPIQKISVAWSLHDSNWFPNFPLSARKAILFYEKTGGPTVDGVITVTPTVMQKLLKITGPIVMDDYDVILTADNFVQNIQHKVEKDYDKEENRPKKILADLAPLVLDKIFSSGDMKKIVATISVLENSLAEKQILLYSSNDELQKIISDLGWSGEILQTSKDYLSVVNTNINGYKTDGVVSEKIRHQANIMPNGSIIDTITVTRKHNGGNEKYEWWNKVNADYMRVYVPKGSQLLDVEGQTKEADNSPVDYTALNFQQDADVQAEEAKIKIDKNSGTRIYDEFGKTVFANWVYVSPQEKVVIKYKYLLPFKIKFSENEPVSSYSLLVQKQSGSFGSDFSSQVNYPKNYKPEWLNDDVKDCSAISNSQHSVCVNDKKLVEDKFFGIVFGN